MPAIVTDGLTKGYPGGVEALRGVDLAVDPGELFAFLGPNGAGKTTAVRILVTLLRASGGTARVAGFDVATQPGRVRRVIGVALQEAGLDPVATGRELLRLHGRLHGLRGGALTRRVEALLELVGLTDAARRAVGTYSGGMQRRLDLASALVHAPEVLFLDEPTTGLDPVSRRAIWDEVRRLNTADGVTVFLTTQYLEEADQLAHRLAIIDGGRIVAEGAPAALKAAIGVDVVTLALPADQAPLAADALGGLPGIAEVRPDAAGATVFVAEGARALPEILRRLDRAGVAVEAVTLSHPSLDEVFLRATGHRLSAPDDSDAVIAA